MIECRNGNAYRKKAPEGCVSLYKSFMADDDYADSALPAKQKDSQTNVCTTLLQHSQSQESYFLRSLDIVCVIYDQ